MIPSTPCPGNPIHRTVGTAAALAALGLLALLAAVSPPDAQAQRRSACASCHGELELLRQHVATLPEARALHVPDGRVAASAHGEMACARCHEDAERYPHSDRVRTATCASCHEDAATAWNDGVHALDGRGSCASCHGVHDVRSAADLATPEGVAALRKACATCHLEAPLEALDPHADSVSCAGCHEPHRTLPSEDDRATVHVNHQVETCGACHELAARGRDDAHGRAVPELSHPGGTAPAGASRADPPACTACHGGHEVHGPSAEAFAAEMTERCAHCHEPYAESFADSYHGQASRLGSEAVAQCWDCHGAHDVFPAADARSAVSEARLLDTCRACHAEASAGFVFFQPHADHKDRERYPYVYWAYHLMMGLLIGTFGLFGLHTALWLSRLGLDALRARDPAPAEVER